MVHRATKLKEFRFHLHVAGTHFTSSEVAFLALRFGMTTGGTGGGKSSAHIWIAKRSVLIWAMIVEIPDSSSGGFGNGNTLFLRFFMTTVMPPRTRH
jgi:hypothetical protein